MSASASSPSSGGTLDPLRGLLDSILDRLCAVESRLGIDSPPRRGGGTTAPATAATTAVAEDDDDAGPHPALVAYDEHVARTVAPFAESCDAVGLGDVGSDVLSAWGGVRAVVELGTRCRRPPGDASAAIAPHLEPVRESVSRIRAVRLDRRYDWHLKAVAEMLAIVSWPVVSPPARPAPASFVKEAVGSSDFWSNKVRKEHKGRDDDGGRAHIKFCDDMRRLILDLAAYVKEYHLSGLMWNPRGKDLSEVEAAAAAAAPEPAPAAAAAPTPSEAGGGGDGGGIASVMAELSEKKSADGSSAATGLRHVAKEQRTRRREFHKEAAADKDEGGGRQRQPPPSPATERRKATAAEAKRGPPVLECPAGGKGWAVENQTGETAAAGGGVVEVPVEDPKHQVYVYRCVGVTIKIAGKVKNVVMDECVGASVVFDTAISACEIVNCRRVQVQSTGTCPTFTVDKTDGCLIYVSRDALTTTGFVTSKSSEMNVSWEDEGGEVREAPIPEQFQHRLVDGAMKSDVSDLYH